MTGANFDINLLKDILIKKAKGFYYNEELLEYESQNKKEKIKSKDLLDQEGCETDVSTIKSRGRPKKITVKEGESVGNIASLVMVKKKVSTHFVPPDSLAIKMLFEIFGKEIMGESEEEKLSKMSDDDLKLELKKINKCLEDEGD